LYVLLQFALGILTLSKHCGKLQACRDHRRDGTARRWRTGVTARVSNGARAAGASAVLIVVPAA
jgi:hypothetical protein